jgi:hypothetical protein
LDAEGACLEAQAAGRVHVLLLNGVLLSRSGGSGGASARASAAAAAAGAEQLVAALESLRVRLRMAGLIPPTPLPAAPPAPRRQLRRTASDESQSSVPAAPPQQQQQHGNATAAVSRARALAAAAAAPQQRQQHAEEEEAREQRPQSPLFSFRCPITHVRPPGHFCDALSLPRRRRLLRADCGGCARIAHGGTGAHARPGGGR